MIDETGKRGNEGASMGYDPYRPYFSKHSLEPLRPIPDIEQCR
jgi:hypothetical protein